MDTCRGHITHVFSHGSHFLKSFLFLKQFDTMIKNSISGTLLRPPVICIMEFGVATFLGFGAFACFVCCWGWGFGVID
jgi:hypothetical protein